MPLPTTTCVCFLVAFPVSAAARKRCAAGVRTELLRGFLCVAVNFNEFAWLPTFNDAAPRDSLLFTCCTAFGGGNRPGASREARLLRRVEAICHGYEQRAADSKHDFVILCAKCQVLQLAVFPRLPRVK